MKKVRVLLALFTAVVLLFSFCACSSSSDNYYSGTSASSSAYVSYSPMAAPEAGAGFAVAESKMLMSDMGSLEMDVSTAAQGISSQRKIVKHVNLSLETMEFDKALSDLRALVQSVGGYIESQSVDGVSFYSKGRYNERNAWINARIPADKLDAVTDQVGTLCNIVSRGENMDDITDSYYDTKARLQSLELQEERLLAILEKAERLEEVITLEQALSNTRYQIESLTASIRRMDGQVDFSYLNINLSEVIEYQTIEPLPKSFGERISIAWGRSLTKIQLSMEGLLFFMIEDAPLLIIELLIFILVVFVVIRIFRKIKILSGFKLRKKPADASLKTEKQNPEK